MIRLKELREETGKTMRQIAAELEIPYTTYVNYEKGVRKPQPYKLVDLAEYFRCSVDYLLGRTNNRIETVLSKEELDNEYIAESKITIRTRLVDVMKERGVSYDELEKLSEVSARRLKNFIAGGNDSLSVDELCSVLESLDISVDYIFGGDKMQSWREESDISKLKHRIIRELEDIDPDVIRDIDALLTLSCDSPEDFAIVSATIRRLSVK